MQTRPANEFALLDGARGLAALAVVFYHRGPFPAFPGVVNAGISFGYVGVSVFFVISGFVIWQSALRRADGGPRGALEFLKRRALRIYPAYWAGLVLCLAVSLFVLSPANDRIPIAIPHWNLEYPPYTPADLLSTATLTYCIPPFSFHTPNVVYWTLAVEQQFYLLVGLLILPVFRRVRVPLLLASTAFAAAHELGWFGVRTISFYLLPRHWMEFVSGILLFMIVQRSAPRWATVPLFLALVAGGLAPTWAAGNQNGPRSLAAAGFALLLLAIYPLDGRLAKAWWLAPVRYLGRISYSLYLIHFAGFALHDWLMAAVLPRGSFLAYAGGIAAALLLASGFWWLFERPFLSRQRRARARPVPTPAIGAVA